MLVFFPLFANFFRNKSQIVRRNQGIFNVSPLSFQSSPNRRPMQMSVAALSDIILLQDFQNLRTLISLIQGRIMEKTQDRFFSRSLQRHLKPSHFPGQNFGIMGFLVFFQKPAAGTANGIIPIKHAVIVENFQRLDVLFRTKAVQLGRSCPPVIVISLNQILFSRKEVSDQG